MQTVEEIYIKSIRPLGDGEKIELAALILDDVSPLRKSRANGGNGSISELFGSVSLGYPTGSHNESIDADLAREYMSRHEDEN